MKDAYCPRCGSPAWCLYAIGEDGRYSKPVGWECPICGDTPTPDRPNPLVS